MLYLISQKARMRRAKAKELFKTVLQQSRQPYFYEEFGVPDTMEGRFEMLSIHGGLLVDRLCRSDTGKEGRVLAQTFFDVMFKNVDWGMRESGVGDLAVPRRIKKMMSDFKGRAYAYNEAYRSGKGCITHALLRNVYPEGKRPSMETLEKFATYVQSVAHTLDQQGLSDFWLGRVHFPPVGASNQNNGINNDSQAA